VQGLPSSRLGRLPPTQLPAPSQISLPLQTLLSAHDVPAATGACATPAAGSQESVVQGLPSSITGAVPDRHCPEALQVSFPLHALPSEQEAPSGATGFEQLPVDGSHVPAIWHKSLAVHVTALPAPQEPAWQVSLSVHLLPSSHAAPFGLSGCEQVPVLGSHVPTSWHWSRAVHVTGLVPVQVPAWHVSVWLQALPSLQAVPSGLFGFEQLPVEGLHEPAAWH
jgi:hypothetical protein